MRAQILTLNSNIGHNVQALFAHFDPDASAKFVHAQQGLHVSILSLCSFAGRIISGKSISYRLSRPAQLTFFFAGTSSDILVKTYGRQRLWLIVVSAGLFFFGQVASLTSTNPYDLWKVSSLNGLGYGMLFGVCPTIVSEAFGVHGLSTNWGFMTVAAVISGNALNLFYGKVYDGHSMIEDGHLTCDLGLDCYRNAYWISLAVVFLGMGTTMVDMTRNRVLSAARDK